MSFFDTLKSMGLFPPPPQQGQAPQGQPQQAQAPQAQPNGYGVDPSYGVDPAMRRQAGWQALGNVSQQLFALSQQMTPQQRSSLMQNVDFSGGYQQNLAHAQDLRLRQRELSHKDQEYQRAEEARTMIADRIKSTPPGRLRDAAMYFFQSGDLAKAGELLWSRTRQFDPATGQDIYVDAMGYPSQDGGPLAGNGQAAAPSVGGGYPPAAGPSSGSSVAPGGMPPAPGGGGQVDQLTTNYRALTNDPTLTPAEALVLSSQGSRKGLYDKYQEIVNQRQSASQAKATLDQTTLNQDRGGAEKIKSDYDALAKGYVAVVNAAQLAEQVTSQPNMSPSDKLSIIYNYAKTNDPTGAVQQGDMNLMQGLNSWMGQLEALQNQAQSGGTITDDQVRNIARTMATLGNRARTNIDTLQVQSLNMARERKLDPNMVFGRLSADRPRQPIGAGIPPSAPGTPPRRHFGITEQDRLDLNGGN